MQGSPDSETCNPNSGHSFKFRNSTFRIFPQPFFYLAWLSIMSLRFFVFWCSLILNIQENVKNQWPWLTQLESFYWEGLHAQSLTSLSCLTSFSHAPVPGLLPWEGLCTPVVRQRSTPAPAAHLLLPQPAWATDHCPQCFTLLAEAPAPEKLQAQTQLQEVSTRRVKRYTP